MSNEAYVDAEFQKTKANFVDKGVPVVVGEYGAYLKTNGDGSLKCPGQDAHRKDWTRYVTKSMNAHGLVTMLWGRRRDVRPRDGRTEKFGSDRLGRRQCQ